KIRETTTFGGLAIAERLDELKCGVAVVDLRRGQVVGLLEFQTAVEEIFAVQVLPGLRFPEVMGFQQETIHHTFIVPLLQSGTARFNEFSLVVSGESKTLVFFAGPPLDF